MNLTTENTEDTELKSCTKIHAKALLDGFSSDENWSKYAEALENLCRKLERERDEAIAARENSAADWLGQVEQANARVSRALQQVALAERERDEAREALEVCRGIIKRTETARNSALTDLTETEKERDEAREYVDRYRERLDLTPMSWEAAK